MKDTWETYWENLLRENKLAEMVAQLDYVDSANNRGSYTKAICEIIFRKYDSIKSVLNKVHDDLILELNSVDDVYLRSSRIKSMDSLIMKVIKKRYSNIESKTSKYTKIDGNNYVDIITDLIGARLIISHNGKWKDIHRHICKMFPLDSGYNYAENGLMPHRDDGNFQSEPPKAYYVNGDDIESYKEAGIVTVLSTEGYRSIHYIVSYEGVYVEIQVRPIHMEPWCAYSHDYVYKHGTNPSDRALNQLSVILSDLFDASGDIGDMMKEVYEDDIPIKAYLHNYLTTDTCIERMENIIDKIVHVAENLNAFKNKLKSEQ